MGGLGGKPEVLPFCRGSVRDPVFFLPFMVEEMSADNSGTKRLDWLPPNPNNLLSNACSINHTD